jgi:hypothetical protein
MKPRLNPLPETTEDVLIWRGVIIRGRFDANALYANSGFFADRRDAHLLLLLAKASKHTRWDVTAGPVQALVGELWEPVIGRPLWARRLG